MDLALSSLSIILIKSNLFHKINNRYEIQHDQIVLQWSNGNTNGSPALEFVIEAAKVRDYTVEDMQGAAAAAHDALHGTYEDELERQREMNASLSGGSSFGSSSGFSSGSLICGNLLSSGFSFSFFFSS